MTPSITLRQDIRLINLAFESERMAVPKAKFIGLSSADSDQCSLPRNAGFAGGTYLPPPSAIFPATASAITSLSDLFPHRLRNSSLVCFSSGENNEQAGRRGSPPRDIRQLSRRRLDRGARFQQHRRRIPRAAHELISRAIGDGRLDDVVAEVHLLLLDVHRHRHLRR